MDKAREASPEKREGYYWHSQDCPVCGIAPTKFIGKRGGRAHRENSGVETDVWSCGKCSLIFPNPMPFPVGGLGQHYEVGADDYFAAHAKEQKLSNAANLVKTAEKLLGRKGRLLDIGVGRGEVLIAAMHRGWDVEGVEPSESFADYAEKATGAKIWRASIEDADMPPDEYDVVILAAVLEHLYDPDLVIKRVVSVLKKGGLLYLDVPNEKGLYFKVGNAYQKLRGRDWCVNLAPTFAPFHVFGFGPKSFRNLLNKYGLEPRLWKVYGGKSLVSPRGGLIGKIESKASQIVTAVSNLGEMGTYIETWVEKK